MKPDLDQIYSELDLRPNCSLEEFKHAYRRRIAQLHPDRRGQRPGSPENLATLSDLIWVYAMVTRFHRRYGRMPGGNTPRTNSGELPLFVGQGRARSSSADDESDDRDRRRARATMTLVALFIALVVLLASWSWLTDEARRRSDASPIQATTAWASISGPDRTIQTASCDLSVFWSSWVIRAMQPCISTAFLWIEPERLPLTDGHGRGLTRGSGRSSASRLTTTNS